MIRENFLFKLDSNINELLEIAYSFEKARVFLTACEFGVFDTLGDDFKTAEEVAEVVKAHPKALGRLMNALVSMNLLDKKSGKYCNTKLTNAYLVKANPNFIGNLKYINDIWNRWSNLTESIKTGTAVNYIEPGNRPKEQLEEFISAMHWRANFQAPELIKMINLSKVTKILDLGGGSGAYAVEMAKAKQNIDAYVFDLPEVVPIAEKYIQFKGFDGKVKTIAGNFKTDKIGKGYDLVFVSHILHSNSFYDNIELLRKVYDSLKVGGTIVIHDFIIDDDRSSPEFQSLFSLNMLVSTPAGDVMTDTDIWILLKECWFSSIEKKDTPFGSSLMFGTK